MQKVYYPCGTCGGTGRVLEVPTLGLTAGGETKIYKSCTQCEGTGKGIVKEIIEEVLNITITGSGLDLTDDIDIVNWRNRNKSV